MDASPLDPPHPAPVGELIVRNGRHHGARKALGAALTLIGRTEDCDVRLNVEGILPIHCALVRGADGFVIRALPGAPTQLNGQTVTESPVRDGDLLAVGPFQFQVALPPQTTEPLALEREKDALRIQAAAVAAQQTALTEEEVRLQQRRVALERQEAQLSTHLEERRQKLVELQAQVRDARMALANERSEHERRVAETTEELTKARQELKTGEEKLREERRRLNELHQRLKERHAAHWQTAEADLRRREERLGEEGRKLDADRGALNDARLRFNGEAELGRRQLQDAWEVFRRAQKQWDERRGREDGELRARARELTRVEQALADHWQDMQDKHQALEAEADGLESRVRNLRRKMQEQEAPGREPVPTAAPTPAEAPAPAPVEAGATQREWLAGLEELTEKLTDQRLHLLEQAELLIRAREEWRTLQVAALAELEEAAGRLRRREEQLGPRDRALTEAEAELLRRGATAAQLQAHLDGWQARLTARAAAWEADRETLLTSVKEREEVVRRQADALADLRRNWSQRWKKELTALDGEMLRCQAARRQYASLWEDCLNHGAALERQQRALAEKALALEQYRLEVVALAPDSAAAEKRLRRLRRRCAAATAAARRNLDRERQALDAERKRLQQLAGQLDKQSAALTEREADVARRLTEWEASQADAETTGARLRAEVEALAAQRAYREREAQALRDEVERLARLLMDDGPTLLPITQAA